MGVEKRKKRNKKKEVKEKEKEKEKTTALELGLQKVLVNSTGSHSTTWPAFQPTPGGLPHQPLTPPSASTHQPNQLVPIRWGQ